MRGHPFWKDQAFQADWITFGIFISLFKHQPLKRRVVIGLLEYLDIWKIYLQLQIFNWAFNIFQSPRRHVRVNLCC